MMKIKVTAETIINEEEITIRTYIHDGIMEKRLQIAKKVIDLTEKSIREALIQLGWTPPC